MKPCNVMADCDRGQVCFKGTCVGRGKARSLDLEKLLVDGVERSIRAKQREDNKQKWKYSQGDRRIIQETKEKTKKVSAKMDCSGDGQNQHHQNIVQTVVTPTSSVERLLVAHQLGTGKTKTMINIATNFWDDPRPIVVLVPATEQVTGFYNQMLALPNKFRDHFRNKYRGKQFASLAETRQAMQDLLEKKGRIRNGAFKRTPGEPASPLRCYRFTTAASASFAQQPVLKVAKAYNPGTYKNIFDNCVVLVDEGHLLARPDANPNYDKPTTQKVLGLGKALSKAKNARVYVMTATPVISEPEDSNKIMRIVQGGDPNPKPGYVSWFMGRPKSTYAATNKPPNQIPDVVEVPLRGTNLNAYLKERQKKTNTDKMQSLEYSIRGDANRKTAVDALKAMVRGGKPWWDVATKLHRIAEDIKKNPVKTAVMIDKKNGLLILEAILQSMNIKVAALSAPVGTGQIRLRNAKANQAVIDAFNSDDNLRGEKIKVIVLDTREYSEGTSLMNVRKIVLADFTPGMITEKSKPTWGRLKQRIGRALRMCSHAKLPPAERQLQIALYVATAPPPTETFDQKKLKLVAAQRNKVENAMCELSYASLDGALYDASDGCSEYRRQKIADASALG